MCLERADKGCVMGAVSDVQKATSLVGRWLERSPVAGENDKSDKLPGEIVIERDTVVLVDVTIGRGCSSVKASKQYRVIDIHDKY